MKAIAPTWHTAKFSSMDTVDKTCTMFVRVNVVENTFCISLNPLLLSRAQCNDDISYQHSVARVQYGCYESLDYCYDSYCNSPFYIGTVCVCKHVKTRRDEYYA